jgi:hypothetical protein
MQEFEEYAPHTYWFLRKTKELSPPYMSFAQTFSVSLSTHPLSTPRSRTCSDTDNDNELIGNRS